MQLFVSCKEGRRAENIRKNRYRNVVPYDHTRVKLKRNESSDINDYINANFVNVLCDRPSYAEFGGVQKRYISTQGALPNTTGDFWQMVWEQNCRVIVMATKEMERGRIKCHKYWPEPSDERTDDGEGEFYGLNNEYNVRTIKQTDHGEYIVRVMQLRYIPSKGLMAPISCFQVRVHLQARQSLKHERFITINSLAGRIMAVLLALFSSISTKSTSASSRDVRRRVDPSLYIARK